MNRINLYIKIMLLCSLCFAVAACSHEKPRYSELETELNEYVAGKDARIGIAIIIDGTDTIAVNGNKEFPMMSVFKFPIALAIAQWIDSNGMTTSDTVRVRKDELMENTYSPMLKKYGCDDMSITYEDLLAWSLTESDNNASDILMEKLGGAEGTMKILKEMGIPEDIIIGATERDMYGNEYQSYLNRSTPLAMAELFDRFFVSMREQSDTFWYISSLLQQCHTGKNRLASPLETEDAVLGHKTGTGFTLSNGRLMAVNDCGYVVMPDRRHYAIAVYIADSAYDRAKTAKMIADISRIVYNAI